jgi:hypothetical protein
MPVDPESSRRADWRFLIPTGNQERVRDVTDQRLAGSLPPSMNITDTDPCDLVVGSDPRPTQLDHAYASLRPGGVCYFEWRSPLRPSAGSLRRSLEAAGFVDTRLYWSWPRDTPAVWVPLDAARAARWVLRRKHHGAASRIWRAANAARLLRPRCATAVRPPLPTQVGPLGVSLGDLGVDPFWALLAPGSDPQNKVLAFVGLPDRPSPALVLKMPRTAAAVATLEHEAAALQALHSSGNAPGGVPRLLAAHSDGGTLRAIAESPLEGKPLFQLLDRRRHSQLVRRTTEWLLELARVPSQVSERPKTVLELAREAAAAAAPDDRELVLEAGRLAAPADHLPVVFEQRDFSPWNVHVGRDGNLVVFDWESAEPSGYPALDLVYLLAYCGFFLDRALQTGRVSESYRATFESGVAADSLAWYCRTLGIPLDRLEALRALTWLIHLRTAARRDPGGSAAALFLDLLRGEVR